MLNGIFGCFGASGFIDSADADYVSVAVGEFNGEGRFSAGVFQLAVNPYLEMVDVPIVDGRALFVGRFDFHQIDLQQE